MKRLFHIALIVSLWATPAFSDADPDTTILSAPPVDPVLPIQYSTARVAFEQAPASLVHSCNQQPRGRIWILAETPRLEGAYMLISGPIWDSGEDNRQKPMLKTDYYGEIVLVKKSGVCEELWVPDNAFGGYFPDNPGNIPTPYEANIMRDLGVSLLQRAVRAIGGRDQFLRAFDATGQTDSEQDKVMAPLLDQLRNSNPGNP